MKKNGILFLLLYSTLLFSQKEANIWYFGRNAGLDFNSGNPVPLMGSQMNTYEGCASIADSNGKLLFYTDGSTIWNKNHSVMLNGTGLKGFWSSTNSAIIVPKPGNPNRYFVFTVDGVDYGGQKNGINYSEIDMSLDGGLGGVTSTKNVFLIIPTTEQLTAVKNPFKNEYWVVSHKWDSDEFIAYNVSSSGVNTIPVTSAVGNFLSGNLSKGVGAIKISPNGQKLATVQGEDQNDVQIFRFNASNGKVSNLIATIHYEYMYTPYGIEFSQNSKLLYVSTPLKGVFQYNLGLNSEADIINSELLLSQVSNIYGALQLAVNGKIYVARIDYGSLDVINKPDVVGLGCNYEDNTVSLGGNYSRFGLPPFIQSYFKIDDFIFENVCFGETTQFTLTDTVDTAIWDFDDPSTSTNNTSTALTPTHIFSKPGDYNVSVTATVGADTAVSTSLVTIFEQPTAIKPADMNICDTDNDGFSTVDLTTQNTTILNGQDPAIFEVKYYAGLTDFNNEKAIANPNDYTNILAYTGEIIYAKVYNKNNETCAAINDFKLQVFESPKPAVSIPNLTICDNTSIGSDTDGMVLVDLTQKETEILNGQSASNFNLIYFKDVAFSSQIVNPTAFQNTTNPQTIYVQMVNKLNSSCMATTQFTVEVLTLPVITSPVVLKQCDDDTDGFSAFNLTEVASKISTNASKETITYFKTFDGADTNNSSEQILNPTTYINKNVSTDTVWARVENSNGCYRVSEVQLIVSTTTIPTTFQREFYKCDDFLDTVNNEKDGITTFDFSSVTAEIKNLFPIGQQLIIKYYRDEADALAEENPITDPSNYRNIDYPNTQKIYARVDSKLDNDCLGLGAHITLNVEPIPIANTVTINRQCDDDFDGFFPFDTSTIEANVLKGQTGIVVSYVDKNGNALPSPLPNPFLTKSQTITIRVTASNSKDPNGACAAETTLVFTVDKKPVANPVSDLVACDDDLDGLFPFDTSTIENTILNGQTGMVVSYVDENGNALPSPLPNPFLIQNETITASVANELNPNCIASTTINFIVHSKPEFQLDEKAILCLNNLPKQIAVFNPKESNYTFVWSDEEGNVISNLPNANFTKGGIYSVVATSVNGCQSYPHQITVKESNSATVTTEQIKITDDSSNNVIAVETSGLGVGDYEYALQKMGESVGFYQDEPLFENVSPGIYTIYVNDKNNCGTATIDVSVIGYPKFFTPNNDGFNDYWNVIGVNSNFYPNSLIYIYNRFGKLVAKVDPKGKGWNGVFNGQTLPSSDYWFTVELIDAKGNSKIRKGHFSLLR